MVVQINVFICELCHAIETTCKETSPYDDPVVTPPSTDALYAVMQETSLGQYVKYDDYAKLLAVVKGYADPTRWNIEEGFV